MLKSIGKKTLEIKLNKSLNLVQRSLTSSVDIRSSFINFFKNKYNHEHIPSSKIFLPEDVDLNFVCAGMNQFKPVFLGKASPDFQVKRAVNSQRCVRAGGKHNDLDVVGHDYTHHTFFEMLGSWSFNDYFKEEACAMAWELLTNVYCLPKDRLYVTYFGGSRHLNLQADLETKNIWLSLGVQENKILPFGTEDNFWDMGTTGPCGPCTEIHFDCVPGRHNPEGVNVNDSGVVEIWNLVFMQYNRLQSQRIEKLATMNVDTGMGLERVSAVLQGVESNYDTDIFSPIMKSIQEICGCESYKGRLGAEEDTAYRIISDHIRTLTVAIADGLVPGSTGSELILRRILRRAVLAGKNHLCAPDNFLKDLVPTVVQTLLPTYPNLDLLQNFIINHLQDSEGLFNDILVSGDATVSGSINKMKPHEIYFPFKVAKKLYYHDGYPIERLQNFVEGFGKKLDITQLENLHRESEMFQRNQKTNINSFSISSLLSNRLVSNTTLVNSEENVTSVNIEVLCCCDGKGKIKTQNSDDSLYVVLDKSFSEFENMNGFKQIATLKLDDKEFDIDSILKVDHWVLHKIAGKEINETKNGVLSLNTEISVPIIRAKNVLNILKQSLVLHCKKNSLFKYKVKDDEIMLHLSGTVYENDLQKVMEDFHDRLSLNNDAESSILTNHDSFMVHGKYIACVKYNKSSLGRTTLTFLVGPKALEAYQCCETLDEVISQFEDSVSSKTHHKDDLPLLKKTVGQLTYKINNSRIPFDDKRRLQLSLETIFKDVKSSSQSSNLTSNL